MVRLEDLVAKTRPARTRVNSGNPLCGIPTPQGKDTQLKPLRGLVELRLNQRPVTESPSPNPRHRNGTLTCKPFFLVSARGTTDSKAAAKKAFLVACCFTFVVAASASGGGWIGALLAGDVSGHPPAP